ncbi:hypothetical protein FNV43_RR15304 [Rhamnella rubrinervis]|uniref:Methyltransferase-like protein 13 n=1 Tax=Rhamnella rubrinervis TaxID=2594499 RepID=A0A8K0E8S9_9ROSA|nr:hypothetical protein FNV43_RR15304 [Rhamnella rubrinervis]
MALDKATFETIAPSRFISFTFPHPSHSTSHLRIAVLDSPFQLVDSPTVAVMFVPKYRESDWIFSTESGHFQLLLSSSGVSRLIVVGNPPIDDHHSPTFYRRPVNDDESLQNGLEVSLKPLFLALSPKSCFKHGIPEIPILRYEDNVICSLVLGRFIGSLVGEMVVEDVEIEGGIEVGQCSKRKFRRRLRFKRMPNFIQTEIPIVPKLGLGCDCVGIGVDEFWPDIGVLVHPYLAPMAASLRLIGSYIEERLQSGFKPKILCLGVGGGALLAFLRTQLDFTVVGVEADEQVVRVAKQYFGLKYDEHIKVCIGDAVSYVERLACQSSGQYSSSFSVHRAGNNFCIDNDNDVETEFDVVMVDLDSRDAKNGVCAPPLEFINKNVLLAARSVLCNNGILTINVISPSSSFRETIIHQFREVFSELYEIDVGNGENFVLIATVSPAMFPCGICIAGLIVKSGPCSFKNGEIITLTLQCCSVLAEVLIPTQTPGVISRQSLGIFTMQFHFQDYHPSRRRNQFGACFLSALLAVQLLLELNGVAYLINGTSMILKSTDVCEPPPPTPNVIPIGLEKEFVTVVFACLIYSIWCFFGHEKTHWNRKGILEAIADFNRSVDEFSSPTLSVSFEESLLLLLMVG